RRRRGRGHRHLSASRRQRARLLSGRAGAGAPFALTYGTVAKLKDKVQDALDENRMMVLGVQVLIGFDYRAVFERGFEWLPRAAQLWKLGSLGVLLVTFALLIAPGADHRIGEEGEDSSWFHRY